MSIKNAIFYTKHIYVYYMFGMRLFSACPLDIVIFLWSQAIFIQWILNRHGNWLTPLNFAAEADEAVAPAASTICPLREELDVYACVRACVRVLKPLEVGADAYMYARTHGIYNTFFRSPSKFCQTYRQEIRESFNPRGESATYLQSKSKHMCTYKSQNWLTQFK